MLSPELAAGIGRVKGAKSGGVRLGKWLSADEVSLYDRLIWMVLKGKTTSILRSTAGRLPPQSLEDESSGA
ncbi:MAG TPA: hypothetical protein VES20_16465 [Bryobacteraceae bacterium]|nr:hypothetical protein [Bryobacteraceae bacterium]